MSTYRRDFMKLALDGEAELIEICHIGSEDAHDGNTGQAYGALTQVIQVIIERVLTVRIKQS